MHDRLVTYNKRYWNILDPISLNKYVGFDGG
jgi:hypothetical protein